VLYCSDEGSGKIIQNPYLGWEITIKIYLFFPLVGPIITPSFSKIGLLLLH